MLVSLYNGANDPSPVRSDTAFDLFVDQIIGSTHRIDQRDQAKTPISTYAYSPAEFDGNGRKAANVLRVHFGVADIDKVTADQASAFLRKIKNLRAVVHTTWSHGFKPGVSLRVIFALSRPVEIFEWARFRSALELFGEGVIDTQTKNPDRLYFVPVSRRASPANFILKQDGAPLDVDALIAQYSAPSKTQARAQAPEDSATTLAIEDLKDLSATLKRKQSARLKQTAAALDLVIAGRSFADPGQRDETLFKLAAHVAEYFPRADPESVAALFRQSLEATIARHGDGEINADLEKVIEKVTRCQREHQETERLAQEEQNLRHAAFIRDAYRTIGQDRSTPYTVEEVERFKSDLQIDDETLRTRWILQNGTAFYLFFDGAYLAPITEKSLITAARRDLAPAITCGVSLVGVSEKGEALTKTRDMILADYATCARSILVDLNAQRTSYDAKTQAIVEAPCPIRTDLKPVYVKEIDDWLTALGGAAPDLLRDWVGFVTRLDSPSLAIYLDGPRGVGKTLFAKGLSRIWTKGGPTELRDALESFNETILRCPLVFADETLPKDILDDGTAILREFQQNTTRKLNRKYMPKADMIGAIRLVMASNNKNLIETNEHLTNADIEAINERVLYVNATDRAREILDSFGPDVSKIVTSDLLASHALYLKEHGAQRPAGRFLIRNNTRALARSLTTHSGVRAIVCQWLVSYLQRPQKYDMRNDFLVHVRNGELWVNSQALAEGWELYSTNAKAPTTHKLSQAISGLAKEERKQARIGNKKINFRVIDAENLFTWCDENGIASREEIEFALAKDTKIDGKKAISLLPDLDAAPNKGFFG